MTLFMNGDIHKVLQNFSKIIYIYGTLESRLISLLKSLGEKMTKYGKDINLHADVLQHQCGMVYKATDASLLSSGVQPFVVEVIISRLLTLTTFHGYICLSYCI